jgi:hypothetical protein
MMGRVEENAPIQQSVHVDCPIEDAFRLFTDGFGEWWPLASHSITEEESASCTIEPWVGGRVFERTRSGEEHRWGFVTVWEPPSRVEFTWNPGLRRNDNQTVTVEFLVEADGTRVTLTHSGWQWGGVETCSLGLLTSHFCKFVASQVAVTA